VVCDVADAAIPVCKPAQAVCRYKAQGPSKAAEQQQGELAGTPEHIPEDFLDHITVSYELGFPGDV